ncbi:hypothetical protein Tco_0504878 [Tanacetum coccineum]
MIGNINLLWKTVSEKLNDAPIPESVGNFMASKNIASINHIKREELTRKGIKSPSKLFSPKYISLASIIELNKNPSARKHIYFVNSIVILSKESGAEEGETTTDITPEHDHNIMKEAKDKEKEVMEEDASEVETNEEVKEILEDEEEEEEDEDGENFNSFPTMKELTHHEWLLKNPRPPWVKARKTLAMEGCTTIKAYSLENMQDGGDRRGIRHLMRSEKEMMGDKEEVTKAHLLEDKQIPSVGVFDEHLDVIWRNTRDLGSFREETDEITDLHQIHEEILFSERGDGVACIKRHHRDPSSNGVRDLVTSLGCGILNEDLESSTQRRRQDYNATPRRTLALVAASKELYTTFSTLAGKLRWRGRSWVFDLNKSVLCPSFIKGLTAKGLGPLLGRFPYWSSILPKSNQTVFDAPPGFIYLGLTLLVVPISPLLLSCARLMVVGPLSTSSKEMAFRNFIYTEDDEDLSFLPKEPSPGFGTGSPFVSVNTEPLKADEELVSQPVEVTAYSKESLKPELFVVHPRSVAARIKDRKCKTRGGSSRPHVKGKLAPGSLTSRVTRAKTSSLKDD